MECSFDIKVTEPEKNGMLFRPFINFRMVQLNLTPNCMTEREIDEQVDMLVRETERLRKKVKNDLKKAISKHDQLTAGKRKGR